ncbi:hypothetical protein ANRL4_03784 [Anaerolineae bacterium]|nr:hypothetical protein ANRL4_03784 [Anaerolineae bacterium]
MNDLWQIQTFLVSSMQADTTLTLAHCAVWLDPVLFSPDECEADSDDDLTYALHICRRCFPEVYTEAVQRLWRGENALHLNRAICVGMNRHLVTPLQDIAQIQYGVPFEALGLDREDPDFRAQHPRLARIADWFDCDNHEASEIAAALLPSLAPYGDKGVHADLAHLIVWLFGISGNTLVDWTDEQLWENSIEPPDWTPDDLAFIHEVQEEAHEIVTSAYRALDLLEADDSWAQTLQANIHLVRERKKPDEPSTLRWQPDAGHSPSDPAHPDPELLPLWGDLAPSDGGWGDHRIPR